MTGLLLAFAIGCDFSAATRISADTGETDGDGADGAEGADGGAADGGSGGDGGGAADDTGEEVHPSDVDDDADGFTENEGDCDDDDDAVHPGVVNECDGVDDDCDDEVDEDARDEDAYEPNDDVDHFLGSLNDDGPWSLEAPLHSDEDIDRYTFDFEDSGWTLFTVNVGLSSIPDGATYRLTIENTTTGEQIWSEFGEDALTATIADTILDNESGTWRVTVDALGGADCARRYLLAISMD